jgi:hypothetical protein
MSKETDFGLHHKDGGSEPADTEVVGSAFFIDVAKDCILDLAISARGNADELLVVVLLVLGVDSHIDGDAGIDVAMRMRGG